MKRSASRLLSTLLVLCMVLALLPGTALAADTDFVIEDGVLIRYDGPGGTVTVPSGVTAIGDSAFEFCSGLTSVTIPGSVASIGVSAFYYCEDLTSVTIANGVASIGWAAFQGCTSLTSVTIPASVTSIAGLAFGDCISLTDVYYGGSESQWEQLDGDTFGNDLLLNANIHYSNDAPSTPGTPSTPTTPTAPTAYASTQTVELDGKKVEFQMYALKDANGNDTNYIKVRDLAMALKDTKAEFSVDWADGVVSLAAGETYTPNGSENATPFSGNRGYTVPTDPTNVNGAASDLQAILLNDDAGGGFTYYKLRDLGSALGFNVSWSAERGVFIETDKPYSG